jgi:hypothetical protein
MRLRASVLFFLILGTAHALEISNVRTSWDGKAKKERIVIDLSGEGQAVFFKDRRGNRISLAMEANLDPVKEKIFTKVLQKTRFISTAQFINLPEEGEVTLEILLSMKIHDSAALLSNPSRIVLDIGTNKNALIIQQ